MRKTYIFLIIATLGINPKTAPAFELKPDWERAEVHGFAAQGFMISENNNIFADTEDGTFQFNELGVNVSMEPLEHFRGGIQIFSRDLGDIGNNDIIVDWAFFDYRWRDWMGIRAGKIKNQYGFYNYTRDIDILRTWIFLPSSLYDESMREHLLSIQGAGIYGHIPMQLFGSANYSFQFGKAKNDYTGLIENIELGSRGLINIREISTPTVFVGCLEWDTPLNGLRTGASAVFFELEADATTTDHPFWTMAYDTAPGTPVTWKMDNIVVWVFSAEYTWENLILAAEYYRLDADTDLAGIYQSQREEDGYYLSAVYRFSDLFELGAYYSEYFPDRNDRHGKELANFGEPDYNGWEKEFVVSNRFDITEYLTLKIEGHWINGTAYISGKYNPDGFEKNSSLYAIKAVLHF